MLFFSVKTLAEISNMSTSQGSLVVGDHIYGVTINAQILEGLKGASSRKKMALTLLEELFSGDVLAKSEQCGRLKAVQIRRRFGQQQVNGNKK